MTINEVFKRMTDIINYHLFPFLRTKDIEHKHRVFVEDFILQLYDTLNTALKNPNNPRYKIDYEVIPPGYYEDEPWTLSVKVGEYPALPNTYHLSFLVQGDTDAITVSKMNIYFDYNRKRHVVQDELISFVKQQIIYTDFYMKALRKGQKTAELVFHYMDGRSLRDRCTYSDYL